MFLRFIIPKQDPDSHVNIGVFMVANELRDSGRLTHYELDRLHRLLSWFNTHLKMPKDFSRTRSGRRPGPAISWFKDSARQHLQRLHELVAILREHDIPVEMISTDNPGYIIYEDDQQIVAEPFADTRREVGA